MTCLCLLQDPYNMERVFWLLLGRDGAKVKTMMEEFERSHRHSLPEDHRRLVPPPAAHVQAAARPSNNSFSAVTGAVDGGGG